MFVLITGVAGFIGTNLANTLLKQGRSVVGVDNFIIGQKTNTQLLSQNKNFSFIQGDIREQQTWHHIARTAGDCEAIYHLACPTGVPNCEPLGIDMLTTSVLGTRLVLEFARRAGARTIFTSSSEVYGDPEVSPQKETYWGRVNPIGFRSPYEEGKRIAESLIVNYVQKRDVYAVIARVFNTYGPHVNSDDTRVIPRFIRQALSGRSLTVYNDGNQTRTFCYVSDTVAALLLLMKKGKNGDVYNVGSTKEMAIKDLAELVVLQTNSSSNIVFAKSTIPDHNRRRPDIAKMKQLGWYPTVPLQKGLKRVAAGLTRKQ